MPRHGALAAEHFGRLFPDMAPCRFPEHMLQELADAMTADDPALNERIPAGFTYFGQFIDHDLTFDKSDIRDSRGTITQITDASTVRNRRSAKFDLDSLFGDGPDDDKQLYDASKVKLLLDGLDVPRESNGKAIVGDPRNDENLILVQMHVLWARFYNIMVDRTRVETDHRGSALHEAAKARTLRHYQWIVANEFLRKICGPTLAPAIRDSWAERKLTKYLPEDGSLPVEFSGAAYRFGHSMVRRSYNLSSAQKQPTPVFGESDNLRGGSAIPPEKIIDWARFFQQPGADSVQLALRLDQFISTPLMDVPDHGQLALRNLERAVHWRLPSGLSVARELGLPRISDGQIVKDLPLEEATRTALKRDPPLWLYVLQEARAQRQGQWLGKVGGRIVGEVLVDILSREDDPLVARKGKPKSKWTPDLTTDPFGMFALQAFVTAVEAER